MWREYKKGKSSILVNVPPHLQHPTATLDMRTTTIVLEGSYVSAEGVASLDGDRTLQLEEKHDYLSLELVRLGVFKFKPLQAKPEQTPQEVLSSRFAIQPSVHGVGNLELFYHYHKDDKDVTLDDKDVFFNVATLTLQSNKGLFEWVKDGGMRNSHLHTKIVNTFALKRSLKVLHLPDQTLIFRRQHAPDDAPKSSLCFVTKPVAVIHAPFEALVVVVHCDTTEPPSGQEPPRIIQRTAAFTFCLNPSFKRVLILAYHYHVITQKPILHIAPFLFTDVDGTNRRMRIIEHFTFNALKRPTHQ